MRTMPNLSVAGSRVVTDSPHGIWRAHWATHRRPKLHFSQTPKEVSTNSFHKMKLWVQTNKISFQKSNNRIKAKGSFDKMIVVLGGQKRCTIGESIILIQLRTFLINNHIISPRKSAEFNNTKLQNNKITCVHTPYRGKLDLSSDNFNWAKNLCACLLDNV